MRGTLILVVGPSGSGKGALMEHLRAAMPEVVFPVSCTTRSPRPSETEGAMYFFVTEQEFDQKIAAGEFLEWASYGGNRYGTLKSQVLPALEAGKVVVREVEVQGARQIQALVPKEHLKIIFIDAGSWEDLERRILGRAPIEDEELQKRRKRFDDETNFMSEASTVVQNRDGGLEKAKQDFVGAVRMLSSSNVSI